MRRMDTTERRDGYPASRVLARGTSTPDRLIAAYPYADGDGVRLEIINPSSGELKAWSVDRAAWLALVTDVPPGRTHNRHHPREHMRALGELAGVTEPAAVVVRQDGSLDAYGPVGIVDQRPPPHLAAFTAELTTRTH